MAATFRVEFEAGDEAVRILRIAGEYLVSFRDVDIPPASLGVIENALQEAFEYGKLARSREIRKLLEG